VFKGIAYVELYVADGSAAVQHFTDRFFFDQVAAAAGERRHSVLLRSNDALLVVTTPTTSSGPVADWLARHGDGIADVAVYCDDLPAALRRAERVGLPVTRPLTLPGDVTGSDTVASAQVKGAGSAHHTLLSPPRGGVLLPPGNAWNTDEQMRILDPVTEAARPGGIDHLAWCLPTGTLETVTAQYRELLQMTVVSSEKMIAGDSVADSYVLHAPGITFVLAETDRDRQPERGGQIDQFVDVHADAGVQHIAFSTDDIVATVRACTAQGVRFLDTPAAYYDLLPAALRSHPDVAPHLSALMAAGVLVDQDDDGLLYQVFTTSPHERGAVFYEFIQRAGSLGFGQRNVRALFQAREAAIAAAPAGR
jgi:4-hydroxymandelate synthase